MFSHCSLFSTEKNASSSTRYPSTSSSLFLSLFLSSINWATIIPSIDHQHFNPRAYILHAIKVSSCFHFYLMHCTTPVPPAPDICPPASSLLFNDGNHQLALPEEGSQTLPFSVRRLHTTIIRPIQNQIFFFSSSGSYRKLSRQIYFNNISDDRHSSVRLDWICFPSPSPFFFPPFI